MTRFLLNILVILMLWVPDSSIARTLNRIHIEENDKGITLQVNDASLGEVLLSIENKTSIHFHISPSVLNDPITTNLTAPDWQTAVNKLLEPYGRAELWNTQLELTEIHILSRTDTTRAYTRRPPTRIELNEEDKRFSSTLHRNKLIKLARGSLNKPIPPGLYDDPEIQAFLNNYGIQSRDDMKDTNKARTIRIKARKILRERDQAK